MSKYTDEQIDKIYRLYADWVKKNTSDEELINGILAVAKDFPNIIAEAKQIGRYMEGHGGYDYASPANWAKRKRKINTRVVILINNTEEAIRTRSVETINVSTQQNTHAPVDYNPQLEQENTQVNTMKKYTDEQVNQISRLKVDYVNNIISGEELINSVLAVAKDYPNPRSNIIADAKRFGRYMKGHGERYALPTNWAKELLAVTNNDPLVIKALKEQQKLYEKNGGKVKKNLDTVIENAEEAIRTQSIGTMNIPAQQNMSVPVNYNLQLEQENVQVIKVIIDNIENIPADISTTELETLIKVRIGQSVFRQQLLDYWNNSCSVTGCRMLNVLIASHIKPWRDCNGAGEKLDVMNGLLLIPNIDALFDKGFISFEDDGKIIISSQISEDDQKILGVNEDMVLRKKPSERHNIYLEYHRKNIFQE